MNNIIEQFNFIFKYGDYDLPIRCKEKGYIEELKRLYDDYMSQTQWRIIELQPTIRHVCELIIGILNLYLSGKPGKAFEKFKELYDILIGDYYLTIYPEIDMDPNLNEKNSKHSLYRIRKVDKNISFSRKDIFHTPFNLRNIISTNRYSIAGYPCLYLSSSIELCQKELECDSNPGRYIISRFEVNKKSNIKTRIIELGIKPQDFFEKNEKEINVTCHKRRAAIDKNLLEDENVKKNYLIWYPFIAACSFIRPDKNSPFSIEYVLPQMLMQYIREEIKNDIYGSIQMGIRYFSCASILASELGFNYVFPTDYENRTDDDYCGNLAKLFNLTEPIFMNEYLTQKDLILELKKKKIGYYCD